MRVLAIVQTLDSNHPSGGFIVGWMEKLSERVDKLVILTLEKKQEINRGNVKIYSLGKENYNGFGCKLYYLFKWHQQMRRIGKKEDIDLIFTHMTPLYSVLACPYFLFKKTPIITWFLNPKYNWVTKLAHLVSSKIVSATTDSYPYKKDKLVAIGHGINTEYFNSDKMGPNKSNDIIILSVGRVSAVKDYLTLVRAVNYIKSRVLNLQIIIMGNPVTKTDINYKENLIKEINLMAMEKIVKFEPAQPTKNLKSFYEGCFLLVNATQSGSLDKVVLEAMACGRPVIVASKNFKEVLGNYSDKLTYDYGNHIDLGNKLLWLLGLTDEERNEMCKDLQKIVLENYSVDALMTKLVGVFVLELKKQNPTLWGG